PRWVFRKARARHKQSSNGAIGLLTSLWHPRRFIWPIGRRVTATRRWRFLAGPATRLPILFASDVPILRESLKAQFEQASDFEVVATARDKDEVIPLVQACRPKLVLLDL